VCLLGDLDLAEEEMHKALAAAPDTLPQAGIPDKPPVISNRWDLRLSATRGEKPDLGL